MKMRTYAGIEVVAIPASEQLEAAPVGVFEVLTTIDQHVAAPAE
ncbi:hypothetical protein [Nocardia sp. NPDC056100]